MIINREEFPDHSLADTPFNLANIPDFNSLIAQSQKHNVPIFALTKKQIEQQGVILNSMVENRDNFREIFNQLAKDVISLTSERA